MRDLALHCDLHRALAPLPMPRPLLGAARRLVLARRRDAKLRRVLRVVRQRCWWAWAGWPMQASSRCRSAKARPLPRHPLWSLQLFLPVTSAFCARR